MSYLARLPLSRAEEWGYPVFLLGLTGLAFGVFGGLGVLGALLVHLTRRRLRLATSVGVLTALAVVAAGGVLGDAELIAGAALVAAPLVADGRSRPNPRTRRYTRVGGLVLILPSAVLILTAGAVWTAAIYIACLLAGAAIAVVWYAIPV
jgi:hypothetical protein